ncbi:MAG: DUF1559 domain-containing protein [Planctomycetaceae bacterium]|nr:DUF1559 domain-containing protein [Planctomycetaceae bacterium]
MNSRVFPANKSLQFRDVTDGLSNTLMGGEIADGFSPWSRPGHTRDPALGLNKGPLTFGSPYFGQKNYSGVQMLLMDGSVRTISDDIDPAILKALATPDAGDDLKGYVP